MIPNNSARRVEPRMTDHGSVVPPGFSRGGRLSGLRAPRRGDVPTLTVVIASCGSTSHIEGCIAAVSPQCSLFSAEFIVVRAGTSAEIQALARLYPAVRFIIAPVEAPVTQLRAMGMAEASGDIVVIAEDHFIPDDQWLAMVMAKSVPSGAETSSSDRPIDWQAYFRASGAFTRHTLGIGER